MPSAFPVAEAQIVALFMEAVAYGVYLVTAGLCARALLGGHRRQRGARRRWPLAAVAGAMALFATLDVAFGLRHNLDAFVFYSGPGGADAEFEDISYWVNVMKTVDVQMMTLIGDGMLIYRCLVVFSYNWLVVAFPVLLWLANAVCSAIIIYITATLRTDALLSVDKLAPFLTAFLVVTLATNLLTTGLIVWRIWRVDRASARAGLASTSARAGAPSRLAQALRIVVESGALYTALVLATFGTELAGSNAIYGVSDVMVVVVGISFNLIIIRVDRGLAVEHTYAGPSAHSLRFHTTTDHSAASAAAPGVQVVMTSVVDCDGAKDAASVASAPSSAGKRDWDMV